MSSVKKHLHNDIIANPFAGYFVPKKKKPLTYGKTTLHVYPDITHDMGNHERSLAFNINKTALRNAFAIKFSSKLGIMSELHNCESIIDVQMQQYRNTTYDKLRNNTNMTVSTYHS